MQQSIFDLFPSSTDETVLDLPPVNETALKSKPVVTDEIIKDFKTSAKTAMFRKCESAPIKVLIEKGLLSEGSCINYGKGKYEFDTDAIREVTGHCVSYDYVHLPKVELLGNSYNTLYSGYVVNTLPIKSREVVWHQMSECTKGIAFVAARTDARGINGTPFEDGVKTTISTFQKCYQKNELLKEAKRLFKHVVEIKGKAGFSLVACSHNPLPQDVLNHAK